MLKTDFTKTGIGAMNGAKLGVFWGQKLALELHKGNAMVHSIGPGKGSLGVCFLTIGAGEFSMNRSLTGILFARFVISAGNFVFPFLTFFLTQKLAFSAQDAGLTMSLLAVAGLLGSLVGGYAIDRFGHILVLPAAGTICAAAFALVPMFSSVQAILGLLFLGFFLLAAYEPAFNALVAASFPKEKLRKVYSALYVAGNLGFVMGPLAASQLFDRGIKTLFWGDSLATALSCFLVMIAVRSKVRWRRASEGCSLDGCDQPESKSTATPTGLRSVQRVAIFCAVFSLWPLVLSQIFFAIPMLCSEMFKENGVTYFGFVTAFNGALVVLLTPIATRLTQNLTPKTLVALGGLFYAFGFGGLFFVRDMATLLFLTFVWTIGEVLSNPNARLFVLANSDERNRGRCLGMLDFSIECGYLGGPFLVGLMISATGNSRIPWIGLALLVLVGAIFMFALGNTRGSEKRSNSIVAWGGGALPEKV